METSSEPSAEETGRADGAGRRAATPKVAAVAVACGLAIAAIAAYAFLDRPATAEAALHSGHYWTASKMLSVRAEEGDARAQNALANLYYLGLGVEQDQKLASRWYLAAALQSNSNAQINLARQYSLGQGLPRDALRAYAWLVQARSNQNEFAEVHMKLLASGSQLTPNQMQRAKALYPKLEDLRPKDKQGGND